MKANHINLQMHKDVYYTHLTLNNTYLLIKHYYMNQGSYICIITWQRYVPWHPLNFWIFYKNDYYLLIFFLFFISVTIFCEYFFLEISISKSHFTTDNILENYGNSKICNSCHTMIYIDIYIGYLSECRPLLHIKLLVLRYSIRYRYFPN